ncbi:MAG: hypothetical protein HQL59_11770 [Magnetococcales bacterium]|nr:hypothetical protein [Magnetococcales bacterium]
MWRFLPGTVAVLLMSIGFYQLIALRQADPAGLTEAFEVVTRTSYRAMGMVVAGGILAFFLLFSRR